MSENLLYGTDITSYGADITGKNSSTDALIKALENGESLICFPFGTYLFTKSIELKSNTKLHFHPSAKILYCPQDKKQEHFIFSKNTCSIVVSGGVFDIDKRLKCTFFSFENCQNVQINSCTINSKDAKTSVFLSGCQNVRLSNIRFDGKNNAVSFFRESEDVTIKNSLVNSCDSFISLGEGKKQGHVQNLTVRNIDIKTSNCVFDFAFGSVQNCLFEDISASFNSHFVYSSKEFSIEGAEFENISAFCTDAHIKSNVQKGYFIFEDAPEWLEINNFSRKTDFEATPFIQTLYLKNASCEKATAIIDGITLDNIISSRGKSQNVQMTPAKLSNPTNKFIYTLETSIPNEQELIVPFGSFDYLNLYRK